MADDLDDATSGWTFDPRARIAMTLMAGRDALMADNAELAMMVAEEILDENPEDLEAFDLLAEAAMRCGHAPLAVLATEQAASRGARNDTVRAAALLAAVRVEAALSLAAEVAVHTPEDARAHAVRGQALELAGRLAEADAALAEATRLAAHRYPPPLLISEWDPLLLEAISTLSDAAQTEVRSINVYYLEAPDPDLLALAGTGFPPRPPTCCGVLYRDGIALFTRTLARGASSETDVVERIAEVLTVSLAEREQAS